MLQLWQSVVVLHLELGCRPQHPLPGDSGRGGLQVSIGHLYS